MAICLRFFAHCERTAARHTFQSAIGSSSAIRMAMMAITTSNSISVEARQDEGEAIMGLLRCEGNPARKK
jgi:hypothetical protein